MKRRDFVCSAASIAALGLGIRDEAVAASTGLPKATSEEPYIAQGLQFSWKQVTVFGSTNPASCNEHIREFYASRPNPGLYPIASFGSSKLNDALANARPLEETRLVAYYFDEKQTSENKTRLLRSVGKVDPDLCIFEKLAGSGQTASDQNLQSLIMVGRPVAGAVLADDAEMLFRDVANSVGELLEYLTSAKPRIQVFLDGVDKTDDFLVWAASFKNDHVLS